MTRTIAPLLAFFSLLYTHAAYAGAWTQNPGDLQTTTSFNIYKASRYFDTQGDKRSQPAFYKEELSTYVEYGFRDDVTLGGQLSLARAFQQSATAANSAFNLGDSEFFVRKHIWQNDASVLSLQPSITLPSPDSKQSTPKIGGDSLSAGIRAAYGHNFQLLGAWHYADLSAGYIHRLGRPADQLKLETTVGLNITDHWQLLSQLFITHSTKHISAPSFTQSAADDYDAVKLQLSVQYKLNKKSAVQLGAFLTPRGENTGVGQGVTASYVRSF